MSCAQDETITRLTSALRTARGIIKEYREMEWESCTIAPNRSFDQMEEIERRAIKRLDRALKKITAALE